MNTFKITSTVLVSNVANAPSWRYSN